MFCYDKDMSPKRILVVDDDMSVLQSLDAVLTSMGFYVLLAPNGADGLEIVNTQWIDCIILDLNMPLVSGYVFLQDAFSISMNKEVKTIILTGQLLMAGPCKLTLPNIEGQIKKPFEINELKQCVLNILRGDACKMLKDA